MGGRVLLVEDDKAIRFGMARHLERSGFVVAEAVSCETARERFRVFDPHAVVTDYRLPDGEALPLISDFRRQKPTVPILVLTGYGTIDLAVRAVKRGASNLLTKPVDMDQLVAELRAACPAVRPASGVHEKVPSFGLSSTLLGSQPELEQLKDLDCSLLILGETGTGKTLLARWLHNVSRRREMPFVDLNCAGLARDLVESELFGHERGAFTSAHAAKRGMFDLADGGTLFLDEIGDVDAAVQPKLLKAIEEKRFRPLGGGRERSVDVRVVAATHCNLREAARANRFRSDLYYRLSTVTVTLPSLRQRRAEIPSLANDLLASLSARIGRSPPDLAPDAEAALLSYSWPGNVRELKNVLERALHFAPGDVLFAHDLVIDELGPSDGPSSTLRDLQREHVERALAIHGSVGDAARSLGISRSSMYLKVKAYGLVPARGSAPRIKVAGRTGSGQGHG